MVARNRDTKRIRRLLGIFPVVALLGPRQSGKTTLAGQLHADHYFDLESPADQILFDAPQRALGPLRGLIVLDEIQRNPALFSLLRVLADETVDRRFLILGSASPDLVRHGAETLAGRIGFHYLGGFSLEDVGHDSAEQLWIRGGFPRSFLAEDSETSRIWRDAFIQTYLERDISFYGVSLPPGALRRFWTMVAHYSGQVPNFSEIGRSFGVSDTTVRHYLDLLEGTFTVRLLQPWSINVGKRLVKRPRIYVRDTGLLHALLGLTHRRDVLSHPKAAASWEGFALEQLVGIIGKRSEELYFYRTHAGAEVDLLWEKNGRLRAAEMKLSDAPRMSRSMHNVLQDLNLDHLFVIYPGERTYPMADQVTAVSIRDLEICRGAAGA